jgi:hypothetical protein
LWLITVVLSLAACGSPELQPLKLGEAPWRDGETSKYDVTDLNQQYAGVSVFVIRQGAGDDAKGWTIRRQISTQGDQETVEVELSSDRLRPRRSALSRTYEDGTEVVNAVYNDGIVDMQLTSRVNLMYTQRSSIPTDSYDAYTLWMVVRALPLAQDYATSMTVFTTITGALEQAAILVKRQEQVSTPAGVYTAWRVQVEMGSLSSTLWIGTEQPHPLVKIEDGRTRGTFELTEFIAGS